MLILSILFPVLLGLIILLKREFKNRKVLLTLTGAGLAITAALGMAVVLGGETELMLFSFGKNLDIYFHVDTMSQMMNHRPVIINMEMPVGADYDLTVYDENGNQVGMAVENEGGTKTLTIPCDWSNSRRFVIKVSQNGLDECVEGNYKLTFFQGEMPQEV